MGSAREIFSFFADGKGYVGSGYVVHCSMGESFGVGLRNPWSPSLESRSPFCLSAFPTYSFLAKPRYMHTYLSSYNPVPVWGLGSVRIPARMGEVDVGRKPGDFHRMLSSRIRFSSCCWKISGTLTGLDDVTLKCCRFGFGQGFIGSIAHKRMDFTSNLNS